MEGGRQCDCNIDSSRVEQRGICVSCQRIAWLAASRLKKRVLGIDSVSDWEAGDVDILR